MAKCPHCKGGATLIYGNVMRVATSVAIKVIAKEVT